MKTLLERLLIMCIRQNLAISLVLAISMAGVSYGAGGDLPGDGLSESTAYLIEDLADFDVFVDPCNSATYWASGVYTKLVYDIDLTGKSYTTAVIAPDGSSYFGGVFNGDSHIVSNMTIDTMSANNNYLGLFGKISGSSAEIKNIGIENININGGTGSRFLGGLCGYNKGTITNCYAAGSVTGDEDIGGLCGRNWYGTITNCYATGSVTGGYGLGGLCGYNSGTISNCFWDVETSGVGIEGDDNYGATGKTTEQMQMESTFTDAGWDFDVVPVWHMPFEVVGYPMLGWQKDIPGDFTGRYGVDLADFAVLAETWGLSAGQAGYNELCDIIDDDMIDLDDLAVFVENWLAGK